MQTCTHTFNAVKSPLDIKFNMNEVQSEGALCNDEEKIVQRHHDQALNNCLKLQLALNGAAVSANEATASCIRWKRRKTLLVNLL